VRWASHERLRPRRCKTGSRRCKLACRGIKSPVLNIVLALIGPELIAFADYLYPQGKKAMRIRNSAQPSTRFHTDQISKVSRSGALRLQHEQVVE